MAVNLSPYGGVGAQFLDNAGNVLTGGKIFTYAAGTTTNQATYTDSTGTTFHPNPIILDASGRVPSGGEIWLTDGLLYKFVLETSTGVLIATYDNIAGINSNFVNFTNQQEIQTATAGQTVFTLATTNYTPGTNSLSVFVDGVNQYGPGSTYAYLETNSTTVTFTTGLHVGAEVKFTTSQSNSSGGTSASVVSFTGFKGQTGTVADLADDDGSDWIGFEPAGTNAVARSAQDKMRDSVSVKDFGAVGNGIADDTLAIQNAINSFSTVGSGSLYFPAGTYLVTNEIVINDIPVKLFGDGIYATYINYVPTVTTNSCFKASYTVANRNKGMSVSDLSLTTSVAAAGDAFKVEAILNADPTQLNYSGTSLDLHTVNIVQSGSGYWTNGVHAINIGGITLNWVIMNNFIGAAQNDPNTASVFCEQTDARMKVFRTVQISNCYILRAYTHLKFNNLAGQTFEALYVDNSQFVGTAYATLLVQGQLSAVAFTACHMAPANMVIDAYDAILGVLRITACDIRKALNGTPVVAGPLFRFDNMLYLNFTGNTVVGYNSQASSNLNYCFQYSNLEDGTYPTRTVYSGNAFASFYYVYGNRGSAFKILMNSNTYSFIEGSVYENLATDTGATKYDAVFYKTVVIALTGSGTQTIDISAPANFFSDAYPVAFLQQASASGSDTLSIRYDYTGSTSTNCRFIVTGNATFVGNCRFSLMASPVSFSFANA
jgi:hypothetical protein